MKKLSDAKVRVFWAEYKYFGVFLVRLLRQVGGFATKGRKGGVFCRKGYKTPSQPNGKNKDAAGWLRP